MLATWLPAAALVPAAAQEGGGDAVLDKAFGPVFIVAAGSKTRHPARGGDVLLFGDSVRTGPGGVAQLRLRDRGAVLLHENTSMTLSGDSRRTLGEFLIGLKRKLEKGAWFETRTPAAVAAVRGALFWGRSDAEPSPHAIPVEYTDRFRVDGGLQGLEALVDLPKR